LWTAEKIDSITQETSWWDTNAAIVNKSACRKCEEQVL